MELEDKNLRRITVNQIYLVWQSNKRSPWALDCVWGSGQCRWGLLSSLPGSQHKGLSVGSCRRPGVQQLQIALQLFHICSLKQRRGITQFTPMDGASAKSVIITRVKPSDLWCRLLREVFGNTTPQKLCIAGLRMAFSITALVTWVTRLLGNRRAGVYLGGEKQPG